MSLVVNEAIQDVINVRRQFYAWIVFNIICKWPALRFLLFDAIGKPVAIFLFELSLKPCNSIWVWRYLTRRLIWHLSQSSTRPSLYFSSIVKSRSSPFLEPTYLAKKGLLVHCKCSRYVMHKQLLQQAKSCGSTGARTQGLSLTVRTLYHWATDPPGHITNNFSP